MLRALAILCVVMIHTTPNGMCQVLTRPFTNVGVAVFIFASGYLTPIKTDNIIKFYTKRILRILIPYVVWTLLYTLAYKNYGRLAYNLLTAKIAPQFYYVFVYIQLVLITPLLNRLANSKFRFIGWIIAPVMTIIFKYIPFFTDFHINKYVSLIYGNSFLAWFTFYYLGILLGNNIIKLKSGTVKLTVFYIISIGLQMLEGYWWMKLGNVNCGTQNKVSTLLTSSLFLLIVYKLLQSEKQIKYNFLTRGIELLGDCSFGIYLSHILVIRYLKRLLPIYGDLPFCLNSLTVLIVSFACVLIGRFLCKNAKYLGLY